MQAANELIPPRFEGAMVLPDGRQLGYAEYGPRTGFPLFWFHGTPGARRQISPGARRHAEARGVRIIAIDRPGIGASTLHLYDRIRAVAYDVSLLANGLELGRFAVAGLSGGGPYALACAHELPKRVTAAAVLGGVAPARGRDRIEGGLSGVVRIASPFLTRTHLPVGSLFSRLAQSLTYSTAESMIDVVARFMPPGDQRVFQDPLFRHMFIDDILSGANRQFRALLMDAILFGRHWGFELGNIRVPVLMWYGDADNIVPLAHGEHMAASIPNATIHVRHDEGHLGGLGASEEVLDSVLELCDREQLRA